jgi:NADPH:quinone reductase-like Zn-dependent oxidoreductase
MPPFEVELHMGERLGDAADFEESATESVKHKNQTVWLTIRKEILMKKTVLITGTSGGFGHFLSGNQSTPSRSPGT